jgi:CRISPR-associated exonuclease Cas4/CRISPR-associated protein Cas1
MTAAASDSADAASEADADRDFGQRLNISPPTQLALDLPAPPATGETPLVPVRMVNEFVYCPRLAFLEWVDAEWADSGDTEEGRRAHVRLDAGGGKLPAPEAIDERPDFAARSVTLASERLGIIAKMDLIEGDDGSVTPVDTKKGKRPHVAEGAYEPERVQVCAQALILEDAGYKVNEGFIWYGGSRERVRVALDEELRARTRRAIAELRLAAASGRVPPPLVDSPKCTRCSLAGICLPDEVTFFRRGLAPRPLNPAADTALPLYVQEPGARVSKSGEVLVIQTEAGSTEVPLGDISELGAARPGVADDPRAQRAAARGDSRHLCVDGRLGARPHRLHRAQERGDPYRAISRRLRRAAQPRFRPQPRCRQDQEHARVPAPQFQVR